MYSFEHPTNNEAYKAFYLIFSITPTIAKGYLNLLSDTKVQRGILLFVGAMDGGMLDKFNSLMMDHNINVFFYMVYKNELASSSSEMMADQPYKMHWDQVKG